MANAGVRGRPIEPLVLSVQERTYLERQVRHSYLHQPAQQKPKALQMDQVGRPDFGFSQTLLSQSSANFMWRTLDSRDLAANAFFACEGCCYRTEDRYRQLAPSSRRSVMSVVGTNRTCRGGLATSALGRYCCKSRKSNDPKNLAQVDLWTSLLLRRFSTPLRRSVIDFG